MIKIAVNSNKKYFGSTYNEVVDGLVESGVNREDIYFFVGGYEKYDLFVDDGVNVYKCDNNSIDFTCLIGIVELDLKSDHWFVIHDTVFIGKEFYSKIKDFDKDQLATPIYVGMSSNMGMYSDKLIQEKKQSILDKKNIDYSEQSIQNYKKLNVKWEDFLINEYKSKAYCKEAPVTHGPSDVYGNGVQRIIEYHECIDLYKIKANWHLRDSYEVNL
jgi:hypothetical protein